MESLQRNLTSVVQNERCELFELDLFVLVRVSTEHVPEYIVKLSLSCLFQDIDNESSELSLI